MKKALNLDGRFKVNPYFCLKHAAYMIGVSDRTVRRWTKKEDMIGFKVGGRGAWYYSLEEINKKRKLHALPKLSVADAIALHEQY